MCATEQCINLVVDNSLLFFKQKKKNQHFQFKRTDSTRHSRSPYRSVNSYRRASGPSSKSLNQRRPTQRSRSFIRSNRIIEKRGRNLASISKASTGKSENVVRSTLESAQSHRFIYWSKRQERYLQRGQTKSVNRSSAIASFSRTSRTCRRK